MLCPNSAHRLFHGWRKQTGDRNAFANPFWHIHLPSRSLLLESWMLGKPSVEPLQRAFSERKRRIGSILDLRHRCASDARKHAQLAAVELTMRKFRGQE